MPQFGSARPGFVPAPDYYPPQDEKFRGAGGLGGTMTPQAQQAFQNAQQGFQAGLAAPSMPAPVYPSVGREAQFANPYGISPEHAGERALPGISPEHAGEKAATYQAPRTWGGACIHWVEFHGIAVPQPGGSLKDCLFDWAIGSVAVAVVGFGLIFLVRGAK